MARNPKMNEKMKEERREVILNKALKLFATKGLAATKIADIAQEASMSQGLMYHYYKSKESIFNDLIKQSYQRMEEAVQALKAMDATPEDKIRLVVREMLQGIVSNELMGYRFLLLSQAAASTAIPKEAKETIRFKGRTHYDAVEAIFRQGQAVGQFRCFDPAQMTLMLWTSVSGLAINKAVFGTGFVMPDRDIILAMFMKGEEKC